MCASASDGSAEIARSRAASAPRTSFLRIFVRASATSDAPPSAARAAGPTAPNASANAIAAAAAREDRGPERYVLFGITSLRVPRRARARPTGIRRGGSRVVGHRPGDQAGGAGVDPARGSGTAQVVGAEQSRLRLAVGGECGGPVL